MVLLIPTGVVLIIKSASEIRLSISGFVLSKPFMSMSFLKLVINSFKEFFFREMIVIFDNFNSIRPWITDLAAPQILKLMNSCLLN